MNYNRSRVSSELGCTLPSRSASVPLRGELTENAMRNREAVKAMTYAERVTGKTVEELEAKQARMRADARARLGLL